MQPVLTREVFTYLSPRNRLSQQQKRTGIHLQTQKKILTVQALTRGLISKLPQLCPVVHTNQTGVKSVNTIKQKTSINKAFLKLHANSHPEL